MDDLTPTTALFTRDGHAYVPSEFARGPWRPDAQHGGPPAALLGFLSVPQVDDGEFLAHIEVELTRPVPLEPLEGVARRERVSGRVHRVLAELRCRSEVVARSNALVMQTSELSQPSWLPEAGSDPVAHDPPPPDAAVDPPRWASGDVTTYHRNAVEHRFTDGTFREPGPATDWVRLRGSVVEGVEPSGLERVLAAADFGSGISAIYGSDSAFGLINANLTVSLVRPFDGEWVSIESETRVGTQGTGLCVTHVGDHHGRIGVATQSLLGYTMRR